MYDSFCSVSVFEKEHANVQNTGVLMFRTLECLLDRVCVCVQHVCGCVYLCVRNKRKVKLLYREKKTKHKSE